MRTRLRAWAPCTAGEWVAELLSAGLLAVTVALVATHWAMPVHAMGPDNFNRGDDQFEFVFLLAISIIFYMVDGLTRSFDKRYNFWALSEEIKARQMQLIGWGNRWMRVAGLWWSTLAVWFVIQTAQDRPAGPLVWLWPLWAIILISTMTICQRRDELQTIIPRSRFDWVIETIVAVGILIMAVLVAYTWAQPAFRQNAMELGLLSVTGSLNPTIICFSMLTARIRTLLRPDMASNRYTALSLNVQLRRYRLYRSRDTWVGLGWMIVGVTWVVSACHQSLNRSSQPDFWEGFLLAPGLILLIVIAIYGFYTLLDNGLINDNMSQI